MVRLGRFEVDVLIAICERGGRHSGPVPTMGQMNEAPQKWYRFVQNFDWEDEQLPLSNKGAMITLVLAYLTMVGMGKQICSSPVQLPSFIPAAHNLVLCIGSLVMFVGTAWEILKVHRCSVACSATSWLPGNPLTRLSAEARSRPGAR